MSYRGGGGGGGRGRRHNFGRGRNKGRGNNRGHRGGGKGGDGGMFGDVLNNRTARLVEKIEGQANISHQGPIKAVALNGMAQLFTGSQDKTAKCWDVSTWSQTPVPVPGEVHCMAIYQTYLFIGMECEREEQPAYAPGVPVGLVRVWDLSNPATTMDFLVNPQTQPYTHTRAVTAIEYALDPSQQPFFITASLDGTIRMWKFAGGGFQCAGAFEGHVRAVSCLQLIKDPNGVVALPFLYSGSADNTIKVWDLGTRACTQNYTQHTQGHSAAVMAMVHWNFQDTHYVITGGLDSSIHIWNASTPAGQEAHVYQAEAGMQVTALCATTDTSSNALLLVGLIDGTILFMQLPDFAPLLVITKGTWGHQDGINQILLGPPNTFTFFTASSDRKTHGFQIKADLVATQNSKGQR